MAAKKSKTSAARGTDRNRLLAYLVEQAGGEAAAWSRIYQGELQALLQKPGLTFGALIDIAEKHGWYEYLRSQPVNGASSGKPAKRTVAGRARRGGNSESIVAFLQSAPKSSASEIAKGTGLDGSTVSSTLQYLLRTKKVQGKGRGRAKVWSAR